MDFLMTTTTLFFSLAVFHSFHILTPLFVSLPVFHSLQRLYRQILGNTHHILGCRVHFHCLRYRNSTECFLSCFCSICCHCHCPTFLGLQGESWDCRLERFYRWEVVQYHLAHKMKCVEICLVAWEHEKDWVQKDHWISSLILRSLEHHSR